MTQQTLVGCAFCDGSPDTDTGIAYTRGTDEQYGEEPLAAFQTDEMEDVY